MEKILPLFQLDDEAAAVVEKTLCDPALSRAMQRLLAFFDTEDQPPTDLPWSGDLLARLCLAAAVAYYPKAQERYRRLPWPTELLDATLADVGIWARHRKRDLGSWGLAWNSASFIRSEMHGYVVRLGRLQCNTVYPLWKRLADPQGKFVLEKGEQVINLHIPEAGPMPVAECLASMRQMADFYRRYRKELDWKAFVCHSWLLDPQLQKLLPENSNIRQFQKLGTIIPEPEKTADTVFRVFGSRAEREGVTAVPWTTSLQKALGKFVTGGGRFQMAWMVIPRSVWETGVLFAE